MNSIVDFDSNSSELINNYVKNIFSTKGSNFFPVVDSIADKEYVFERRANTLPIFSALIKDPDFFASLKNCKPSQNPIASPGFGRQSTLNIKQVKVAFDEIAEDAKITLRVQQPDLEVQLENCAIAMGETCAALTEYLNKCTIEYDLINELGKNILSSRGITKAFINEMVQKIGTEDWKVAKDYFEKLVNEKKETTPIPPVITSGALAKLFISKWDQMIRSRLKTIQTPSPIIPSINGKKNAKDHRDLDAILDEEEEPLSDEDEKPKVDDRRQEIPPSKEIQKSPVHKLVEDYIRALTSQICSACFHFGIEIRLPISFDYVKKNFTTPSTKFPSNISLLEAPDHLIVTGESNHQTESMLVIKTIMGDKDFEEIFFMPEFLTYQETTQVGKEKCIMIFYKKEDFNGYTNIHEYFSSKKEYPAKTCVALTKSYISLLKKLEDHGLCLSRTLSVPFYVGVGEEQESETEEAERIDSTWFKDQIIFVNEVDGKMKILMTKWKQCISTIEKDHSEMVNRCYALCSVMDKIWNTSRNFPALPESALVKQFLSKINIGVFWHLEDLDISEIPEGEAKLDPSELLKLPLFDPSTKISDELMIIGRAGSYPKDCQIIYQGDAIKIRKGILNTIVRPSGINKIYCYYSAKKDRISKNIVRSYYVSCSTK